jgi:hypothetical protein
VLTHRVVKYVVLGILVVLSGLARPSRAGPVELREGLLLLRETFWTRSYEGFSLYDRILGRTVLNAPDVDEIMVGIEASRTRGLREELETRLEIARRQARESGVSLGEAARNNLVLSPARVSAQIEFVPLQRGYSADRNLFMSGASDGGSREVRIFVRGEYSAFSSKILERLQELGFTVKPSFKSSLVVWAGKAPDRALAKLSGVDGVARVTALGRDAVAGHSGLAPLSYVHGAKMVTE